MSARQKKVFIEVNPPGCRCGVACGLPCWQRVGWCESCQQCECEPFATEREVQDDE